MNKGRTIERFVAALASRAPTPGGGSAAALSSALGAALLAKVGRIVAARRPPPASRRQAQHVCAVCDRQQRALLRLMDDDARAYQGLVEALKNHGHKGTVPGSRPLARAQRRALEVPLEICEQAVAVLRHARLLESLAGRRLASDVAAGAALLAGGFAAAAATVSANLDGLGRSTQAAAIRRRLRVLTVWGR
ncbi:MAG: cyclodeaminase/cyclohydrolase family protein [Candidatus Omnitrophica bacterium]|nr:cyclodeaminase/cyclohydrolase family protein [Candidatus Omnitrophota bacterium]